MYIIELIFKLKEKFEGLRQKGGGPFGFGAQNIRQGAAFLTEEGQEADFEDEYEKCEHIFRPVDSTNTVLACVKCGFLIHCDEDEFKKKNIFEEGL